MKAKICKRLLNDLTFQSRDFEIWDTEIPGFILRVKPNGMMTYFLSYRRSDNRKTKIIIGRGTALSPVQARDQAKILLGQVTQGIDPGLEKKRRKSGSLRTFLDLRYKPWIETHRKSSEFTLGRIERCFGNLMARPISDITAWTVERWRSDRLNVGIKPSTVNRDVAALKAAINKAVEWDLLPSNPMNNIRPMKYDKSPVVRYLSSDEETRLRAALDTREEKYRFARKNHNAWCVARGYSPLPTLDGAFVDHLKPLVLLSLNTGLRRGELLKMKWEQVDIGYQPKITVLGSTAKNGSTRHVPLNKEAEAVFHKLRFASVASTGWIFPSDSRSGHLNELKTAWGRLLDNAKIENFRWHDLRHHFASALVMRGVDLNTVRELLGHGDLKMTLRYAHLAPHIKAGAVALLSQALPQRDHYEAG